MTDLDLHHTTRSQQHAAAQRRPRVNASARSFVRHYVEMVVAMFLGMAVLGVPVDWALGALHSTSELTDHSLMLLGMAATMTVPMVAWMRYRGHGWRTSMEMAVAMVLPTFAAIAALAAGVVTDIGTVLAAEHVAMLLGMLAAMLLRLDEYTQHRSSAPAEVQVVA